MRAGRRSSWVSGRADRDQPGHRDVHHRRDVRAGQCRDVRHADCRRARPDLDQSTETLTLYQCWSCRRRLAGAAVRLRGADLDRRRLARLKPVGNGIAQYWWTRAIHLAPTSAVAPFQYFSLIWAMMLGFAIWGDVPTVSLLIGGAIVAGSGLFLLWRESRKAA